MRAAAIAVLTSLILSAPAGAQDEAGKLLLKGWSGYDAQLAKTTHLGFYINGKNMGQATLVVGKAPPSSGATYRLALTMKLAVGSRRIEGDETQLLDDKLSLVSRTETETVRKGEAARVKTITIRKVAAEWSFEVKRGKDKRTCTGTDDGPDHWESALLLARKLPRKAATYVLRGIQWPGWPPLKSDLPAMEASDIKITVPAAKAYQHRGKTVQAHVIRFARGEADTLAVVVDAAGNLLAMWPVGGPPIKFVAGTTEECKRDLPSRKSLKGKPIGAVMVYFKVMFKTLPLDDLDAVMDWKALRAEAGKVEVDLEAFTADLKAQFKKQPAPPGKEALEYLPTLLKTTLKGNTARVFLENRKTDVFLLKKSADGTWRITHFPH